MFQKSGMRERHPIPMSRREGLQRRLFRIVSTLREPESVFVSLKKATSRS
jgi:hypothetical protein